MTAGPENSAAVTACYPSLLRTHQCSLKGLFMGKFFSLIVGITQYQFMRKKLRQAQLLVQKQSQTGHKVLSQCCLNF